MLPVMIAVIAAVPGSGRSTAPRPGATAAKPGGAPPLSHTRAFPLKQRKRDKIHNSIINTNH